MIGEGRDYLCLAELHEQGRNMDMDKGPASAWALCRRNTVVFPGLSSETGRAMKDKKSCGSLCHQRLSMTW